MKRFRPFTLVLLALAVLVSACSQAPESRGLEPQFGTAADDAAVDVALHRGLGHVYVAGDLGNKVFIRQYKRDGSLGWERLSATRTGLFANTLATEVDAAGNAYLAWAYYNNDFSTDPYDIADGPFISKLDKTGKLLWRKPFANLTGMEVDGKGNLYLMGNNSVRKHSAAGRLLWERKPSSFGANMVDVVVAASGNVVASSDTGMIVKYTGGGTQLFRTTRNFGLSGVDGLALGPDEEIAAAASVSVSEGTATRKDLKVFKPDGTLVWETSLYDDMAADTTALAFDERKNVFYTTEHWACESDVTLGEQPGDGALCERGSDSDPERSAILVNKYTPSGSLVWSRVFNKHRPGRDAGTAIAAFSENELYLVGTTASGVSGHSAGGLDAFLMRLNAQGQKVWSR